MTSRQEKAAGEGARIVQPELQITNEHVRAWSHAQVLFLKREAIKHTCETCVQDVRREAPRGTLCQAPGGQPMHSPVSTRATPTALPLPPEQRPLRA